MDDTKINDPLMNPQDPSTTTPVDDQVTTPTTLDAIEDETALDGSLVPETVPQGEETAEHGQEVASHNEPAGITAQTTPIDEPLLDPDTLDMEEFYKMDYAKILSTADKLEQSGNPEKIAIAQELRQIDPAIFELNAAEAEVKVLEQELIGKGMPADIVMSMLFDMLKVANERMVQDIVASMSKETKAAWEELQTHDPNPAQQIYLLDFTATQLMNETLDDIYDRELRRLITYVRTIYEVQGKSIEKVSSLTPDQVTQVQQAFDQKDHELGIQLIYEFAAQNGTK